jgi:hypothetical protein
VIINQSSTNSQASLSAPAKSKTSASPSQQPPATPNQVPVPGKTVKPVFANVNIQTIKNVLQSIQFVSKPLCKVRGSNSTQILCQSTEDKRKLIAKLQSQQIGFHTFTDPADKPTYFLLKGFYHATCDETLAALQASSVPAIKVTDFIRNDNYVIYLVHFDKSINVNLLNHSHKYVDDIVVKWDLMKKSNKKVTQCFRCQQWGHSSINCGFPARCVKCSETHDKGSCPRTSREGDPTCCNCGGPHTSSHRGCPAYKKHLEKLQARSKKPAAVAIVHRSPAPINSSTHFPHLGTQQVPASSSSNFNPSQSVSFARTLSESNNNNHNNAFKKLSLAQAKLNALPNINETIDIFVKMVDELSTCNDQKGQLAILLQYSTSFSFPNNDS